MVKIAMMGLTAVVAVAVCLAFFGDSAQARFPYKMKFQKKYLDGNPKLKEAEKKSKIIRKTTTCNFCHIGGAAAKARKNRNAYGRALAKLLKDKLGEKDFEVLSSKKPSAKRTAARNAAKEKFSAVLTAVEKLLSDPKDKTSATFGELIKSGKLEISPKLLPKK